MSVFPLCSVKTTQKSSLLLSRPLSETNFSLKLAAQHNITSALQGESAAPKTLRNMQVMNFLSFNSLFSCKGRSFVFSPSPENEKKKRIKGLFSAFLFCSWGEFGKKKKTSTSVYLRPKKGQGFTYVKAHLSCGGRIFCSPQLSEGCQGISSPADPAVGCIRNRTRSDRESPHLISPSAERY